MGECLENKLPVTIEKLLHEILCEALNYDLEYKEFVSALVSAYGFRPKKVVYANLINKIETLIEVMYKESLKLNWLEVDGAELLRSLTSVRGAIRRAYLVDDLGLPEIYALARNFGYQNMSLKVIINRGGNTQTFKKIFGVDYMSELSEFLGAQLITSQDRSIHEIFSSRWFSCDELLRTMEQLLQKGLLEIIQGAALIIADHGYDIEHAGGYFRLCHGTECRKMSLSMICPLIFISG